MPLPEVGPFSRSSMFYYYISSLPLRRKYESKNSFRYIGRSDRNKIAYAFAYRWLILPTKHRIFSRFRASTQNSQKSQNDEKPLAIHFFNLKIMDVLFLPVGKYVGATSFNFSRFNVEFVRSVVCSIRSNDWFCYSFVFSGRLEMKNRRISIGNGSISIVELWNGRKQSKGK